MLRLIFAILVMASAARADLTITNVSLLDGTGELAKPGMTIVVKGDRITAVGPAAEVRVPRGAKRIDGAGKYLMPGLMDMHIHLIGAG